MTEVAARDHYGAPFCGGVQPKSGKGAGPGVGEGQRNQTIMIWPSWGKRGTDVYCSSRWDDNYQIYDLYWTPKSIGRWWESKTYDWVFVQELPYDLRRQEFIWSESVNPTAKKLKSQHWAQKMRHMRDEKRGQ